MRLRQILLTYLAGYCPEVTCLIPGFYVSMT